ncbi:MAG: ABC transporter permease [Candidatus Sumerlaeaceae bacterium]|nr:ABC transporter permease [Candidatus Sumerlaeaceae bacterium]
MSTFSRPWQQQLELILSLAKRDLKARYKDSVLGFFWSLFRPAFLTVILWLVFSKILHLPPPSESVPYWLHMLVSVLVWNFFAGSLIEATHSVVANANLIKKVPLDAEVFPLAAIISNGVHFVLAMSVALFIAVYVTGHFSWQIILLPLGVGVLSLFVLSISLFTSALQVYFRDVANLLDLLMMAWFYVTPVLYPVWMVRERLAAGGISWAFPLYMINPVAPAVVAGRHALLYSGAAGETSGAELTFFLGLTATASVLLLLPAFLFFRRMSRHFADEL